ncbi:hypothetical protein DFH07DRAFT_367116 [Mycena maculata]|uniref:Uncharacterized protein n=1 Tax=Mycena maculata TaxID=230809 RepID=A0AAD7NLI5_9AGAR|nr:hypothetical protein DFH07DRAFT_367116 [Mycena maculata]
MYFRIPLLLGLVLFLADLNLALATDKETNASRLRRGLGPLPPRFASRDKAATASASARPSHTPRPHSSSSSSRIQVFSGNSSSLGYVRNSAPIYGINPDGGSGDLRVRSMAGGERFDLIITNPSPSSTPSYLGAVTSGNLALRDLPKVALSNVDQVSDKAFVQSTIWSVNSSTKELEARYMDPDGTTSPLTVVFDAHENEIHFVGDVDVYNSDYADFPAMVIKLYLTDN